MKRMTATAATISLAASLATSLLLTLPAAAGGWASVTVVGPSSAPVAGTPWPLELEVLQHGVTPIDSEQVSLTGRNPASGMVVAANGRAGDTVGRYMVEVVFPDAGDWTVEVGLHELAVEMENPTTISVTGSPTDRATGPDSIDADLPACAADAA